MEDNNDNDNNDDGGDSNDEDGDGDGDGDGGDDDDDDDDSNNTETNVPFPWCTSQSTMSTRSHPNLSRAARAAMATLLKMENPMQHPGSAWCPGGRTIAKPFLTGEYLERARMHARTHARMHACTAPYAAAAVCVCVRL